MRIIDSARGPPNISIELVPASSITDAQSGTLLLAAVDRRGGGKYLWKGINKWKDVEEAYEYWAQGLQWRLCDLRGGKDCKKP